MPEGLLTCTDWQSAYEAAQADMRRSDGTADSYPSVVGSSPTRPTKGRGPQAQDLQRDNERSPSGSPGGAVKIICPSDARPSVSTVRWGTDGWPAAKLPDLRRRCGPHPPVPGLGPGIGYPQGRGRPRQLSVPLRFMAVAQPVLN